MPRGSCDCHLSDLLYAYQIQNFFTCKNVEALAAAGKDFVRIGLAAQRTD